MAVYYKFKSAKDFDSIQIDGHFISVANLKEEIFECKQLGRGTDFDLVITNAQTNEEYLDESTLIPKNTSVLIRRVPGLPRIPIVIATVQTAKSDFVGADSSAIKYPDDLQKGQFGNNLYSIPQILPAQPSNVVQDAPPPGEVDEDSKIRAPALDWLHQSADGFGRPMGGVRIGAHGCGGVGLERKILPHGYVCHRCQIPGHFIQHCPTNGDPNFDIKSVKPPTGIPKSMLMATPDGSCALPSGTVAALKPNEAAFENEIGGLPSRRSVIDLPLELHCPLCKKVMKDAVFTSKCCFKSFCDKCIRDYTISKSRCECGATNILAGDLLPNKTLRDTINRMLESNNSGGENGGTAFQPQDMESCNRQLKTPCPTQSMASKGEQALPPPAQKEQTSATSAPQQTMEKVRLRKGADASEVTHESLCVKEPAPLADKEVQRKPASGEAAKKKKKKKACLPSNATEMQWRAIQDTAAENYMMSMGSAACNPCWAAMQPGMGAFMAPYAGAVPYMGCALIPWDVQFGGVIPQDPYGGQCRVLPFGPPRENLADYDMGFSAEDQAASKKRKLPIFN